MASTILLILSVSAILFVLSGTWSAIPEKLGSFIMGISFLTFILTAITGLALLLPWEEIPTGNYVEIEHTKYLPDQMRSVYFDKNGRTFTKEGGIIENVVSLEYRHANGYGRKFDSYVWRLKPRPVNSENIEEGEE
jgi:hypothetical protein